MARNRGVRVVELTEAGKAVALNAGDAVAWCGYWGVESDTGNPSYVHATGRHNEGSNSIFADGHAKWLKQSEILRTRGYWDLRYSQ